MRNIDLDTLKKGVKIFTYVNIITLSIFINGNVSGHPNCDVSKSEKILSKKYDYKIKSKSNLIDRKNVENIEYGKIEFSGIIYKKWPKNQQKPKFMSINYQYSPDVECDWFPNLNKSVFILDRLPGGDLIIINAF